MKAFWCGRELHNFGDALTPYLIEKITGEQPEYDGLRDERHYFVTGSILHETKKNTVILGAGFMSQASYLRELPLETHLVRGHITKEMLKKQGIECNNVGDPALALPHLYDPGVERQQLLGVVPHYEDFAIASKFHRGPVNLLDPIEEVIKRICIFKYILSSSLHGLIVAHAFNIPALWVEFSDRLGGDGMKFYDYFSSVGITPYKPVNCRDFIPGHIIDIIPKDTGDKKIQSNVLNILRENLK